MRFMMLMIPKGYDEAAPGTAPDAKAVAAMMKDNEELPGSENETIEVRQVQGLEDFPADVQKAAAGFADMQGQRGRS